MFCQKCGTKNPDNGKFCRSCGTDLNAGSNDLVKNFNNQFGNFSKRVNQFGMMPPLDPSQMRDKKGKPLHWEGAITKLFTGIAFLVVTIVLSYSAMGTGWWFWMLIPAFSCLGAGVAQIVQLQKNEKRMVLNPPANTQILNQSSLENLPPSPADYVRIEDLIQSGKKIEAVKVYRETFGVELKEAKDAVDKISAGKATLFNQSDKPEGYVKPPHSIYDTGDLTIPPSVTEGTTRHLEMNSEGETMSLPKNEVNRN